jgi:hypothetical protein
MIVPSDSTTFAVSVLRRNKPAKRREFQASNILLHARIEEPSILMGEWRLAEDSNR